MKLESIQRWEVRWVQILFSLGCAGKQWLSLAHPVTGCGVQACCSGSACSSSAFPSESCAVHWGTGNSACGKHKVGRSWIELSWKGTCRCWQALEIGSQHADVWCFRLGWNYCLLSFFFSEETVVRSKLFFAWCYTPRFWWVFYILVLNKLSYK